MLRVLQPSTLQLLQWCGSDHVCSCHMQTNPGTPGMLCFLQRHCSRNSPCINCLSFSRSVPLLGIPDVSAVNGKTFMAWEAKHRKALSVCTVVFQTFACCRCAYKKAGLVLSRQTFHKILMCQPSLTQDFSLLLIFISDWGILVLTLKCFSKAYAAQTEQHNYKK